MSASVLWAQPALERHFGAHGGPVGTKPRGFEEPFTTSPSLSPKWSLEEGAWLDRGSSVGAGVGMETLLLTSG